MSKYDGAAKHLKLVLLDREMSQTDFAEQVGMPVQSLYNMFNRNTMRYSKVEEFADILGCDVVLQDRITGKIY